MKRNKLITTAVILTIVLAIGGIIAYFTDTDTVANNLKLGKVSIEVLEPGWDAVLGNAEGLTNIIPGQEITKDPKIHNKGNSSVYVFAEVTIPTAKVAVGNDGTVSADAIELYGYTLNDGWIQFGEPVVTAPDATTGIGSKKIKLAYGSATEMTSLAADGNTPVIFKDSKITLKDIKENNTILATDGYKSVQDKDANITIKAYGIQTEEIGNDKSPATVWGLLNN